MNGGLALGVKGFFALPHDPEWTGSTEATPTMTVVSRFQDLVEIRHPNLAAYISIQRGRHDRLCVLSEHGTQSLADILAEAGERISETPSLNEDEEYRELWASRWARLSLHLVRALAVLHARRVCACNVRPSSILVDTHTGEWDVRLADYGMAHMTDNGKLVMFPLLDPQYLAPEALLLSPEEGMSPQLDTWALGIVLVEALMRQRLHSKPDPVAVVKRGLAIIGLGRGGGEGASEVAQDTAGQQLAVDAWLDRLFASRRGALGGVLFQHFVRACLTVDPHTRPSADELRSHPFLVEAAAAVGLPRGWRWSVWPRPTVGDGHGDVERVCGDEDGDPLARRPPEEIAHLWQLLGGDQVRACEEAAGGRRSAPILRMPRIVRVDSSLAERHESDSASRYDDRVHLVSLDRLRLRLAEAAEARSGDDDGDRWRQQPVEVREASFEYQVQRLAVFRPLLRDYPLSREALVREARVDIPPLLRGRVWAAMLDVCAGEDDEKRLREWYNAEDRYSLEATDHQIQVDVPRCHQYHDLLASPKGHRKLRRMLKRWVAGNPDLVYWQGLDSLCAPFLTLNFAAALEPLGYACLDRLVRTHLADFFVEDNSAVMQEHLAMYGQLVAYHDPLLATHLESLGFLPELFAIPWFLTLFAHIFPIDTIVHVWDRLLLAPPSFVMFFALAITLQMGPLVFASDDFNVCINVFSDLPGLDVGLCLEETARLYAKTPPSIRRLNLASATVHDAALAIRGGAPPRLPALTLDELRGSWSPRLASHDVAKLAPRVLVLDIRASPTRLRIPSGLVVQMTYAEAAEDPHELVACVRQPEGEPRRHVTVLAAPDEVAQAREVAGALVAAGIPWVSVLASPQPQRTKEPMTAPSS